MFVCLFVLVLGEGQREKENLKQPPHSAQRPTWGSISRHRDSVLSQNQGSDAELPAVLPERLPPRRSDKTSFLDLSDMPASSQGHAVKIKTVTLPQ